MHLLTLKVVLAATDLDDSSLPPLRTAGALAAAAGAALHIVHVVRGPGARQDAGGDAPASMTLSDAFDATQSQLQKAKVTPSAGGVHVVEGEPAHAIRLVADQIRADVVLVGPHRARSDGRGRDLGTTALSIVTNSWAPCMIVTRPLRLPLERVLVPVDMSDTARGALIVGLSWASALRVGARGTTEAAPTTTFTALHVDQGASSTAASRGARLLEEELDRVRREAGAWAGLAIESAIARENDVAHAIVDLASRMRADLVVLGTRGLGLDAVGRIGSVSTRVTTDLETPVLLVPPAVWAEYAKTQ